MFLTAFFIEKFFIIRLSKKKLGRIKKIQLNFFQIFFSKNLLCHTVCKIEGDVISV